MDSEGDYSIDHPFECPMEPRMEPIQPRLVQALNAFHVLTACADQLGGLKLAQGNL